MFTSTQSAFQEEQIGGSLRDLEEALAELSEQNERLEEDCKDLEVIRPVRWFVMFEKTHFFG